MKTLAASAVTFDARGTRYELVLTQDPNGGVLVAWPEGCWLGRIKHRTHVVNLTGKLNKADGEAITGWLIEAFERLPWGLP